MSELPPIEIVQPAAYRAVVTQHDAHAVVEIQHGESPWITMQLFRVEVPSSAKLPARRGLVIDEAQQHGWVLPVRWPRSKAGVTILDEIIALDWTLILQGTTAHRTRLQQILDQTDAAWQSCVVDTHRVGQVPVADVATLAGISKPRVYQVLNDHPTDKLTQTQALIEQSKRRLAERAAQAAPATKTAASSNSRKSRAKTPSVKTPSVKAQSHQVPRPETMATPAEALTRLRDVIAEGREAIAQQVVGRDDLSALPAPLVAESLEALGNAIAQLALDVSGSNPDLSTALGKLRDTVADVNSTVAAGAVSIDGSEFVPAPPVLEAMDGFGQLVGTLSGQRN